MYPNIQINSTFTVIKLDLRQFSLIHLSSQLIWAEKEVISQNFISILIQILPGLSWALSPWGVGYSLNFKEPIKFRKINGILTSTHTHTHTYIYIYRERDMNDEILIGMDIEISPLRL